MLERLARSYPIASVLEGPADGITGIRGLNSVPLAQAGARVDLVLRDEDEVALAREAWRKLGVGERLTVRASTDGSLHAPSRTYDLVWNFNSLPQADDPDALVSEMCEASRDLVLIFTSNTWNYGFPVHRLHHRAAGEAWSHGDISTMNTRMIASALSARGFRVVQSILVDVPWWPDIDSPIEEVAATFLPFLSGLNSGSKRLERYTWNIDNLPYFEPDKRARLEEQLSRHFLIENARWCPLRVFFAHHRGVIARREVAA